MHTNQHPDVNSYANSSLAHASEKIFSTIPTSRQCISPNEISSPRLRPQPQPQSSIEDKSLKKRHDNGHANGNAKGHTNCHAHGYLQGCRLRRYRRPSCHC
mmetsp:Transcript_11558/g.28464  ORF Transcript_11558/g.28464 Transcript_11558/m.28464 type:complete len:101 (+) Transcript_11558:484-786(+)